MALSGERLKDLREKRRLTQEELAERVGISIRLLQKYEAGQSDPSVDKATKLAEALNTTIDYLAGVVPDSTPYVQGDLSPIERIMIFLFRRRQLSQTLQTELDQAISDEIQETRHTQKQTTSNQ